MTDVAFAIPGDLLTPTGGYAYDRQVLARLAEHGIKALHLALPGSFPKPTRGDLDETLRLINSLPEGTVVLFDGLAYGALPPDVVARIDRPVVALIHHPLGLETGLSAVEAARLVENEKAALGHAAAVIVTSPTTAQLLTADFAVPSDRIHVAEPGTEPALRASGNGGTMRLLAVGSIVPRKAYDVLIEALSGLAEVSWSLTIVGADDRAPGYTAEIRRLISESGVGERIVVTGAVDDATRDAHYANADIFVLASLFEGFGIVLTEALARGLPIVTTTGGAAAATVSGDVAVRVPPGDATALRQGLKHLIENPVARRELAEAAWNEAQTLTRWDDTARIVAAVLKENGA
ncbi:glycosyltransferase family 4 protein [Microvirga brassicacearum]|uniref:Glycosyltransferase family 4 protein n=1 Tax=Microvirga brassicacearum TaxID=2580413 RepID=A0A5N3PC83_9HYPH|nr:glycosyltransferase family 4 protein [Microvirga brassicacearum]KAB0267358.1 glycosyltransferase family 4 protein [Microvirga brassicacearum]